MWEVKESTSELESLALDPHASQDTVDVREAKGSISALTLLVFKPLYLSTNDLHVWEANDLSLLKYVGT